MLKIEKSLTRTRFMIWAALIIISVAVMAFMGVNVARDLRLMNTSNSDNVQWTLSQAEVEFIEYELHLLRAVRDPTPDLRSLRRRFDIFYSRIQTLQESTLYASLRQETAFSANLVILQQFLQNSVGAIDSADNALLAALPTLQEETERARPHVRRLSNSGLNYFAKDSDQRRRNVAITLTQMAAVVSFLLIALISLAAFLNHLNTQNIRRRAEAIAASTRMKIITGTALDAVIVSDSTGRILDFNAAAEQIFGHAASDAIGSNLGRLIVPDHYLEAHEAGMKRMRENGEKRVVGKGRVKLEAKRANGEIFPVEFAVQGAETDEGHIFIAFLRDISPQVKAEKDLVAARDRALAGEKAKTKFLATMSHEIRTPLNGMLGNLSLLRDTDLTPQQARYIQNMDTSGRLLMSHISDVLDITKYDAGKLRLLPVEMNISTLLQDIIDNQSGSASANNTSLLWEWEGTPTEWIRADRDRIQHILMNVIGNAVKFTHGGAVRVTAEMHRDPVQGPSLILTVSDTGIGIDAELLDTIFDDFTTGNSAYDREVGGTGLGLGIAQRFAKALGGSIEVESEKGAGSTFCITLPVEPISVCEKALESKSVTETGPSRHVLLVEDNEINRVVAREMLIAAGHTVTEAHNGREAVESAAREAFDIILMDISMPVLDGRGATREIRASRGASAQTPIVALTANAMAEEQEAYRADGMNDILTKPLTREGLLRVVSRQAARHTDIAADEMMQEDVVSLLHIEELHASLGTDALQPLLDSFVAEVERTLTDLKGYTLLGFEETADRAHKVAGSAATMGAFALRSALIEVEEAAKRGDANAIEAALDTLPKLWAATRPFMKAS